MADLLNRVQKVVDSLINGTKKPVGKCRALVDDARERLDCESQLLGICLRMLAKSKMWPLPGPNIAVSLVRLDHIVTCLAGATTRTSHDGGHARCAAIAAPKRKLTECGDRTCPPYTTDYHDTVTADEQRYFTQQGRALGTREFLTSISVRDKKVKLPTGIMET